MPDLLPITFGIVEGPRKYTWRPDNGWQLIRTWRGPKLHLEGILGHEKAFAVEIDLTEDASPNSTLTITYADPQDGTGQTELSTDYWELHGNDIQKSILEHPLYGGLSASAQAMLRSEIANAEQADPGTSYVADFSDYKATPISRRITPTQQIILSQLYDLWVRDQRHYTESQFVLRKTQMISSNYQLNLAMNGLNQIWLLGQITSTETVPDVILASVLNIPNRVVLIPGTATVDGRWLFGWLKRSPTITQRANNRFEVVQEWWLEVWPILIYTPH